MVLLLVLWCLCYCLFVVTVHKILVIVLSTMYHAHQFLIQAIKLYFSPISLWLSISFMLLCCCLLMHSFVCCCCFLISNSFTLRTHWYLTSAAILQEVDINDLAVKRLLATERLKLNPADMGAHVILQHVEQQVRRWMWRPSWIIVALWKGSRNWTVHMYIS